MVTFDPITKESNVDDEVMITTRDNPFNPFTQWRDWWAYDTGKGYNSWMLVAREARLAPDEPDLLQRIQTNLVIDELCKKYPLIYAKVSRKYKEEKDELSENQ